MTEEYINKTREAVDFLCTVYGFDIPTVADIQTSQAKGDTETLMEYLEIVKSFIDDLINDLK